MGKERDPFPVESAGNGARSFSRDQVKNKDKTREELLAEMRDMRTKLALMEQAEEEARRTMTDQGAYYERIEGLVEERMAEIRIANRQLQSEIENRRRAEEALQTVAAQWRDTLDAITDAVWLMDMDQTIVRCNKAASKLFKKDYRNIVGVKCFELVHGTGSPIEGCPFFRMCKSRHKETVHLPSGDLWLEVSVTPLKNRGGKTIGVVHVVTDITRERRLREAMKESNKRFADMLEGITDGFFAVDKEGRFVYANKKTEKALHKSSRELTGADITEVFPGEFGRAVHQGFLYAFKKGKCHVFEVPSPQQTGWMEVRVYPSGAGAAVQFLAVPEPRKSYTAPLKGGL